MDGRSTPEVHHQTASGGYTPEALPQIAWVSPRKTVELASLFPANTVRTYLLPQLLAAVRLPLDELAHAHLVVMKVPPPTQHGFEHSLLRVVSKVRQVGPQFAIIVLPQERR